MSKRSATGNVVKNRAPAPIQISAEQIVREAADRQELFPAEPIVQIHDAEEYQSHLRDRRKHFEDNIRYRREHIGNWVKYARFEEDNKQYERARSIFERALEVDHRSGELWLRYCEFEMRNEFINHARNVFDRAIQILPRIDFLWYKYVYMEEMVGDIPKCRAVFERWMEWMPDDNAWLSYARFETRCHNLSNAEAIMRRYCNAYPIARAFIRFAKWAEFECKDASLARTVFESALSELEPEEAKQTRLFKQFASFEERQGEYERARVLYRHAVKLFRLDDYHENQTSATDNDVIDDDNIDENEKFRREELYQAYITFEKKHGHQHSIENAIIIEQRAKYKRHLESNPFDYDGWFELAKLEEDCQEQIQVKSSFSDIEMSRSNVRGTYERAISNAPPSKEKDHWRRYIYLWIYYAVYEELINGDFDRALHVYQACLELIPHKSFSFSKLWILTAKLHIRRKDLSAARKLLGRAIGVCGKERIYTEYIELELSLGEIDRCRTLYTQYLKSMPYNTRAWNKFAELERSVGETERCRAVFELAICQTQQPLDMPEVLWKAYIDFEIDEGEAENARRLYNRLLEKSGGHVKVWISYAQFEGTDIGQGISKAQGVFAKAYSELRKQHEALLQQEGSDAKDCSKKAEERLLLLDAWRIFEKTYGTTESLAVVETKMPRRIKRKRLRYSEDDGTELGWEEYFDYQFPDDTVSTNSATASNFKILEMAAKWKQQQQQEDGDDDSDDDEDEEN